MHAVRLAFALLAVAGLVHAQEAEWTYDLPGGAAAPTLYPNAEEPTGVVVAAGDRVIRFADDGSVVWEAAVEGSVATPATIADLDGDGNVEVTVATRNGTVVCLGDDGTPRWTRAFNTPAGGFKSIAAADITAHAGTELIVGFNDGWLRCLAQDGQTVWRFFGDRYRVGPPAVADVDGDGHPEVVYGTDNGHVYCLDHNGQVQWRYDELAPYGRSGTNIADLDHDGQAEVLITRSNVGLGRCLMALDGRTGAFKWRTQDVMQGYVSNAIVSFGAEPGSQTCVLHADKGNWLYCVRPDGTERWRVELGGHGIFWAPAAGDLDGDGHIEVAVGMRRTDPESGATVFVVGQDGTIDAKLNLGGGANAAPAIGDIDGDGHLELIVVTQSPDQLHVVSWGKTGRVEWPSLRGSSAMTGAIGVAPGQPEGDSYGPAGVREHVFWGENTRTVQLPVAARDGDFIEVSVSASGQGRETRIVDLKPGMQELDLTWHLTLRDADLVAVRLSSAGLMQASPLAAIAVNAGWPGETGVTEFDDLYAEALEAGRAAGTDVRGLMALRARAETASAALAELAEPATADATAVAEGATALRAQWRALESLTRLMRDYWAGGDSGHFVFWQDSSPWDAFDPQDTPETLAMEEPVVVEAFGNEFENAALTLLNTTSEPIEVRCMFEKPKLDQGWPKSEPDLAKHVSLHRLIPVATAMSDRVFDPLPELDRSRTITLPPGEARQLWLTVDTNGLWPGEHELTLYLGSLTKPPTILAVPVRIKVWPVSLPNHVFAKMNWSRMDLGQVSDQTVRDMVDHGISSIYGPALPAVPVDANGQLAGEVDWSAFDASLERVPPHFYMLWGGPPTRRWPKDVNPAQDSEVYFNGFKTAIQQLAEHLQSKGYGFDQWAFYPVDEPWNTGFTLIPQMRSFCQMVKRADPRVQNYTDPAGLVRVEYLEEFKDLIDIWQPEMNLLKRDPKLVEWFQRNAAHFWSYEAPGPAKDFPPLGHYRVYNWMAWNFGCEGAGYWIYKGNDVWWPIEDGDWSAVYQTNGDVITSRRWEADRDGVEDYRALYVLREAIGRAYAAGHRDEAHHAQQAMDEMVVSMVGWHIRNIDEITRMTRDHDLDIELFRQCRTRIRDEILRLEALHTE
ncbi:MAG: PQQ-like beta-propeller repeat protein [bacterium]|nr:PQQ-like beta-propeller repeat protein [bacterium]